MASWRGSKAPPAPSCCNCSCATLPCLDTTGRSAILLIVGSGRCRLVGERREVGRLQRFLQRRSGREDHPGPDDHGAVEALHVVRAFAREAQAEVPELAELHDAPGLQLHVEHEVEVVEYRLDVGARDRASRADHLAKGVHVRVAVVLRDGVHLGRLFRRVPAQIFFLNQFVTLCHCARNLDCP